MEWILRVNQVMDYAEEHLCDLIDEQEISRIAACSLRENHRYRHEVWLFIGGCFYRGLQALTWGDADSGPESGA